jgi:hypothetical protein
VERPRSAPFADGLRVRAPGIESVPGRRFLSPIAAALRITGHTVESYFTRLQCKLGLDGMHHLRRRAIQQARHQTK